MRKKQQVLPENRKGFPMAGEYRPNIVPDNLQFSASLYFYRPDKFIQEGSHRGLLEAPELDCLQNMPLDEFALLVASIAREQLAPDEAPEDYMGFSLLRSYAIAPGENKREIVVNGVATYAGQATAQASGEPFYVNAEGDIGIMNPVDPRSIKLGSTVLLHHTPAEAAQPVHTLWRFGPEGRRHEAFVVAPSSVVQLPIEQLISGPISA